MESFSSKKISRRDFIRAGAFVTASALVACASENNVIVKVVTATALPTQPRSTSIELDINFKNREYTDREKQLVDEISKYYTDRNLLPFNFENLLNKSSNPTTAITEVAGYNEFVTVNIDDYPISKVNTILVSANGLLGDNATKYLQGIYIDNYAYASASYDLPIIGVSTDFMDYVATNGQSNWNRITGLHELAHRMDITNQIETFETMLQKKLLRTKLLFEKTSPLEVYSKMYGDPFNYPYPRNPFFNLGNTFLSLNGLPLNHHGMADIVESIRQWESDGFSDRDKIRLGVAILETKEKYPDFDFTTQEANALFSQQYDIFVEEAFASALANIVNKTGYSIELDPENREIARKFINLCRPIDDQITDLDALDKLSWNIRDGNFEPVNFRQSK